MKRLKSFKIKATVIFFALLSLTLISYLVIINIKSNTRICPQIWIIDEREVETKEYFLINNQASDTDNFDIQWIKSNCEIVKKVFPK